MWQSNNSMHNDEAPNISVGSGLIGNINHHGDMILIKILIFFKDLISSVRLSVIYFVRINLIFYL